MPDVLTFLIIAAVNFLFVGPLVAGVAVWSLAQPGLLTLSAGITWRAA